MHPPRPHVAAVVVIIIIIGDTSARERLHSEDFDGVVLLVGDVEESFGGDGDAAGVVEAGSGVDHRPDVTPVVGKHLNAIRDGIGDENAARRVQAHAGRPLELGGGGGGGGG